MPTIRCKWMEQKTSLQLNKRESDEMFAILIPFMLGHRLLNKSSIFKMLHIDK